MSRPFQNRKPRTADAAPGPAGDRMDARRLLPTGTQLIAYVAAVLAASVILILFFGLTMSPYGEPEFLASASVWVVSIVALATLLPFLLAALFERRLTRPLWFSCLIIGLVCGGLGDALVVTLLGGFDIDPENPGLIGLWLSLSPEALAAGGVGGAVYGWIEGRRARG